jgi:transposase
MVLNGLGFASRALYLTSEFFRNKPVARLIGSGIKADQLNDDSLSDALDRLYEAGVTELFAQVAAQACAHYEIEPGYHHLDSSSIHLHGQYPGDSEKTKAITVSHGYSRDHRPDLKQVVVNLITSHQGAIPVWLEVLSGNSSDKTSFPETVTAYQKQLAATEDSYVVADSALYSQANLAQLCTARLVQHPN